jgi:hypothetical protein
MKLNLKIFLQTVAILLIWNALILAVVPLSVQAQGAPPPAPGSPCANFRAQFSLSNGTNILTGLPYYCSASQVITGEIQAAFAIAGVIVILFIIYGGFIYMTSAGNDEQAEKGRKILVNAVIGLVVIIMSTAIVTIVSGLLSGGS